MPFLGSWFPCLPMHMGFQRQRPPCLLLSLAGYLCVRCCCSISHTSVFSQFSSVPMETVDWAESVNWIIQSSPDLAVLLLWELGGLYPAQQYHDWCHHYFSKPLGQQGIIINILPTACNTVIAPSWVPWFHSCPSTIYFLLSHQNDPSKIQNPVM